MVLMVAVAVCLFVCFRVLLSFAFQSAVVCLLVSARARACARVCVGEWFGGFFFWGGGGEEEGGFVLFGVCLFARLFVCLFVFCFVLVFFFFVCFVSAVFLRY